MAAQNGHLELCRFLLQETSLSADNRVLSSALSEFQITAWYNYQDTDESLLEAVYRLFVGECNLDIDILEPPTSPYQLAHTKNSFEVVLASQPTPFSDWSLAQKFTAAVEAVGWPADAFALMLLHHDPTERLRSTGQPHISENGFVGLLTLISARARSRVTRI
jgi:hypothetical protein